jgi:hypothetical protein
MQIGTGGESYEHREVAYLAEASAAGLLDAHGVHAAQSLWTQTGR